MKDYFTIKMPDGFRIAIADVIPFRDGKIITRMNVPVQFRRKGFGRELLRSILDAADEEKVILYLEVASSGEMGNKVLEDWYSRRGFEYQTDGIWKRRPALKAWELIDKKEKWIQNSYTRMQLDRVRCYCAAAAIRYKHKLDYDTSMNDECRIDMIRLAVHIGAAMRHPGSAAEGAIIEWNDRNNYETVFSTLKALDL